MSRSAIVLALVIGIAPAVLAGPLHDAAGKGDLATVETLLAGGAKIDERGTNGETALILAVLAGKDAVAGFSSSRGPGVTATNQGGFTPLHAAAYAGDTGIAELLLEHGADVNAKSCSVSPLHAAAEDHADMVKLDARRPARRPGGRRLHAANPGIDQEPDGHDRAAQAERAGVRAET